MKAYMIDSGADGRAYYTCDADGAWADADGVPCVVEVLAVEPARCAACDGAVLADLSCGSCGLFHACPCETCGRSGLHTNDCAEASS